MNAENCPCRRVSCERRGDCAACREYHRTVKGTPVFCDRIREKEKTRAERREKKAKE